MLGRNIGRSTQDPDLISSLREAIFLLVSTSVVLSDLPKTSIRTSLKPSNPFQRDTETSIEQRDVEIGIVFAFLANLFRRGGDENALESLFMELMEVAEDIPEKRRAITRGLGGETSQGDQQEELELEDELEDQQEQSEGEDDRGVQQERTDGENTQGNQQEELEGKDYQQEETEEDGRRDQQ